MCKPTALHRDLPTGYHREGVSCSGAPGQQHSSLPKEQPYPLSLPPSISAGLRGEGYSAGAASGAKCINVPHDIKSACFKQ